MLDSQNKSRCSLHGQALERDGMEPADVDAVEHTGVKGPVAPTVGALHDEYAVAAAAMAADYQVGE